MWDELINFIILHQLIAKIYENIFFRHLKGKSMVNLYICNVLSQNWANQESWDCRGQKISNSSKNCHPEGAPGVLSKLYVISCHLRIQLRIWVFLLSNITYGAVNFPKIGAKSSKPFGNFFCRLGNFFWRLAGLFSCHLRIQLRIWVFAFKHHIWGGQLPKNRREIT